MIRVVNFLCVALMALTILALYHVSERTRIASVELQKAQRETAQERSTMSVLETEWARVAGPARIQALAEAKLGMTPTASVQLSSLELLPRRGEEAPSVASNLHSASAEVPVQSAPEISATPASVETEGF